MSTYATESDAVSFLCAAGYTVIDTNCLRLPSRQHDITREEMDAARYLAFTHGWEWESDAMLKGADAFRSGVPVESNPYRVYTTENSHWNFGWKNAEHEKFIDKQATDYAQNAWDRAMTSGADAERRFA